MRDIIKIIVVINIVTNDIVTMLFISKILSFIIQNIQCLCHVIMCAYVVAKWASQVKTIMSDLRLRNGNFPFQNRKGCELGLYTDIIFI